MKLHACFSSPSTCLPVFYACLLVLRQRMQLTACVNPLPPPQSPLTPHPHLQHNPPSPRSAYLQVFLTESVVSTREYPAPYIHTQISVPRLYTYECSSLNTNALPPTSTPPSPAPCLHTHIPLPRSAYLRVFFTSSFASTHKCTAPYLHTHIPLTRSACL